MPSKKSSRPAGDILPVGDEYEPPLLCPAELTDGDIALLVERLTGSDNTLGCAAMDALVRESELSCRPYEYFGQYAAMLDAKSSYVRNRAITLIAANARWDADGRIDAELCRILPHISDPKPITARYFIKAMPELARRRPGLREAVVQALKNADLSHYKDSMRPLVLRDIAEALAALDAVAQD